MSRKPRASQDQAQVSALADPAAEGAAEEEAGKRRKRKRRSTTHPSVLRVVGGKVADVADTEEEYAAFGGEYGVATHVAANLADQFYGPGMTPLFGDTDTPAWALPPQQGRKRTPKEEASLPSPVNDWAACSRQVDNVVAACGRALEHAALLLTLMVQFHMLVEEGKPQEEAAPDPNAPTWSDLQVQADLTYLCDQAMHMGEQMAILQRIAKGHLNSPATPPPPPPTDVNREATPPDE